MPVRICYGSPLQYSTLHHGASVVYSHSATHSYKSWPVYTVCAPFLPSPKPEELADAATVLEAAHDRLLSPAGQHAYEPCMTVTTHLPRILLMNLHQLPSRLCGLQAQPAHDPAHP